MTPSARATTDRTLIGREAELDRLRALVLARAWVTIAGLPGVGKRALARALRSALGDDALVLVDAREGLDPEVARAARARRKAVIACAPAPLGVEDEHVLRLLPLDIPPFGAPTEAVLASPATRALLAAAERLGTPILDAEREAAALARVVRRTSGLPRMIELAASNLALLSLDALARLLARPGTLVTPSGASPSAALAKSLARLSEDARAILVQVAPHALGVAVDPSRALPALRELVDAGIAERVAHAPPGETWLHAHALFGALALELAAPAEAEAARRAHTAEIAERVQRAVRALRERNDRSAAAVLASLTEDVLSALEHAERTPDAELASRAARTALEHARATGVPAPDLVDRIEALADAAGRPPEASIAGALERAAQADRDGRADEASGHLRRARELAAASTVSATLRAQVAMATGLHLRDVRRDYTLAREAFEEAARSPDPLERAHALSGAGGTLTWAERFGEAAAVFETARETLGDVDAPRMRAVLATNVAIARIGHWPSPRATRPRTRDVDEARVAAASFEAIGDRYAACVARQAAALAATTLLRFEEAREDLRIMRDFARAVESTRYATVAELDLGEVALALGEHEVADAHLARGLELATQLGDRLLSGVAHAFLGDLAWQRGELGRARDALRRARGILEEDAEHASRLALVLAQEAILAGERGAHLAARAEELAGDESNVHRHAVRIYAALAQRRLGRVAREQEHVLPWLAAQVCLMRVPRARRGIDGLGIPFAVWMAVRRYVHELDPASRRALLERAYGLEDAPGPTLLIDVDRRAVRAPSGKWIDLARRERPFALLEVLARAEPDHARTYDVADLVERVWPGEKMLPSAGANRVYAATAALRKQPGLRDVVQSDASGYRIASELDVLVFREGYAPLSPGEIGA